MKQFFKKINVLVSSQSIINITPQIKSFVSSTNIKNGLINISILHTTASLLIQENDDPKILEDIKVFFSKIVPENADYKHNFEGLDDMPAHIKSCLTNTNLTNSIIEKKLLLGVWQNIYLFEHRYNIKNREIFVHLFGE